MIESASPRVDSLDGLRGVAALVVVAHHLVLATPAGGGPLVTMLSTTPVHLLWAGPEAVSVFFVLSGVVLTLPLVTHPRDRRGWAAYYPARLVRLYLPVLASVLLALLGAVLVPRAWSPTASTWMNSHDDPLTAGALLRDVTLLTGTDRLNGPLWSLRWEVVFSLALPLYVLVAARVGRWRPASIAAAVAVSAVAVSAVGLAVGQSAVTQLPVFALGVLVAVELPRLRAWSNRWLVGRARPWCLLAVVLLGLSSAGPLDAWTDLPAAALVPLVLLSAAGLVVLALVSPTVGHALGLRALTWTGGVSFSLYLVHEPVIVTVAQLLPDDRDGLTGLVALPVIAALTLAFHRWVEVPSAELARRCARRVRSTPSTERPSGRPPHDPDAAAPAGRPPREQVVPPS